MSRGVNKAMLIGNLGQDPITQVNSQGKSFTRFSIATTDEWTDKGGEKQTKTEWHRIIGFGKIAEIIDKYVKKGDTVYIEGKIQTRSYEKDGATLYTTEIVAEKITMLGSPHGASKAQEHNKSGPSMGEIEAAVAKTRGSLAQGGFDDFDDDIPFS